MKSNSIGIYSGILFALATMAMASPVILYGPDLLIIEDSTYISFDSTGGPAAMGIPPDSLDNYTIKNRVELRAGSERSFIYLCPGQMIEMRSNSRLIIDPDKKSMNIISGAVFAHVEEPPSEFCYSVSADSAELRYFGRDSLYIESPDTSGWLPASGQLKNGEFRATEDSWAMKQSNDARYIFRNYDDGDIPDPEFNFRFPSVVGPIFSHNSRGKGGVATYQDETYYYAGFIYRANLWELEFAYDFWFAFNEDGSFYNEAWDEWGDLVDHIHHITLFRPGDPVYLRAGLLENVTYGKGLLVANYDNAVLLPFEKKNGLQMKLRFKKFRADAFINDIGYPKIVGLYTRFYSDKKFNVWTTFVSDFDMYSGIEDSDDDSYPDKVDPQPEIYNSPSDSLIENTTPPSLRDIEEKSIFGAGIGSSIRLLTVNRFRADVSGEIAMLSNLGTGISAPDITLRYRWFTIGGGMDFQTPGFFDGFIDGNYEHDRGYLQEQDDGSYTITGRAQQLEETEGWLYGWNNAFSFDYPEHVTIKTRFRDLYREDSRNKRFGLYLKNRYPWVPYLHSTDFFIEQKNVAHLFQRKSDGQQWGFSFQIRPHRTIRINARYRERYEDENLNGEISSSEIERNFNGNVIIQGEYWLREFIEWRRRKRAEKLAEPISE